MKADKFDNPKVFISYSWYPEINKQKVLELANRLTEDGVRVIIDEWDLEEGQDKFVFMEKMVNDPSIDKVLIICNQSYVEKANNRKGGVGVEGTIISAELYNNNEQTKFIPIIFERDSNHNEYIPTFLKTRIFIDLSNDNIFEKGYEDLLRNLYKKPKSKRPPLGNMPLYLQEDKIYLPGSGILRRIETLIQTNNSYAKKEIKNFISIFLETLISFKILEKNNFNGQFEFIEKIEKKIHEMEELGRQFLHFIELLTDTTYFSSDLLIDFFQNLLETYSKNGIDLLEGQNIDSLLNDHFRFFNKMLFIKLTCLLLKNKEFEILKELIKAVYIIPSKYYGEINPSINCLFFNKYNYTLDYYKRNRDNLRYYTVEGALMKQIEKENFDDMVQADILLYYLSLILGITETYGRTYWYPTLSPYNTKIAILPQISSKRFFEKIKILFEVNNVEEYKNKLDLIKEPEIRYNDGLRIPMIKKGLSYETVSSLS